MKTNNKKEPRKLTSWRLSLTAREQLEAVADSENRSMSNMIHVLIARAASELQAAKGVEK